MKTIIAYALVIIPISTFVVTLTVLLGRLILGLLLAFIPDDKRGLPVGFLCGVLGELAGFGYAFLVFRLLVGPNCFTVLPICVAAIPLTFPPINDLSKARKLTAECVGTGSERVSQGIGSSIATLKAGGIGEVFGFVAGIVLFGIIL